MTQNDIVRNNCPNTKNHYTKNRGVEMMKFIAAIIIVNSHMKDLYVLYPQMATGGAIGDVLFFFCSGYGLVMSKKRSFANYYKRRIGRIYPAVFAWAIISSFVFQRDWDMKTIVLYGGGWFVTCIMVYYIIFWFIHRFLSEKIKYVIIFVFIISIVVFLIFDSHIYINIYNKAYSKFIFFFGFMLTGSLYGINSIDSEKFQFKKSFIISICSFIMFYIILIISDLMRDCWQVQILSLFPLLSGVIYLYKCCNSNIVKLIFDKYGIFSFVGGLCLEIYIVQFSFFTTSMNFIFPLNLFIIVLIIVFAAFVLRCSARIFEQLFNREDFDWSNVLSIK